MNFPGDPTCEIRAWQAVAEVRLALSQPKEAVEAAKEALQLAKEPLGYFMVWTK